MAKVLRNLKITSVDSVDRGAGRGVRVVLAKRDPKLSPQARRSIERVVDDVLAGKRAPAGDVMVEAVAALEASLDSIAGDDAVNKADAVGISVSQCREHLAGKGVDGDAIDAAIGGVVAKHLEVHMVNKSASSRCRHCGGKDPLAGDDEDEADTEKRLDLGVVRKAAMTSHDSIVADFRKRMPAASEAEVLKAATDSAEYMQLFRDEREAAFRSGGHL
jgi:hypothetical protein